MTLEQLKRANELAEQIKRIEWRIDGVKEMINNAEDYHIEIVARHVSTCETLFEGDDARDMLCKHLVELTAKHELMITEFERL